MKTLVFLLMLSLMPMLSFGQSRHLSQYHFKKRIVILIYNDIANPNYVEQLKIVRTNMLGVDERDILVLNYLNSSEIAVELQSDFSLPKSDFIFLLVGKDGYKKLVETTAVKSKDLFNLIDSMPMRRAEMKNRKY